MMIPLPRTASRLPPSLLRSFGVACLPPLYALLFTSYALPSLAQPKPDPAGPIEKDPPAVDQAAVDAAVGKGAEWLRARVKEGLPPISDAAAPQHAGQTYNEIVLYALLHAGVDRGDPGVLALLQAIRAQPPVHTYTTAIRAMALEFYDPVRLRPDLIQCGQFLADNQGQNGQWGYSKPVPLPSIPKLTFTPSAAPPNYTRSGPAGGNETGGDVGGAAAGNAPSPPSAGGSPGPAAGPPGPKAGMTQVKKEPPKYVFRRRAWGEPNDNSNTQYALLGLRACMAAGVFPPPDCLPAAEKWLTDRQQADGGWNYADANVTANGQASYGNMTAGGVSGLGVCVRGGRNRDPRQDPRVQKGVAWLAQNLSFRKQPGGHWRWHFYWVYGVERAGALSETEWFGDRPWYSEGAEWLLRAQHPDGAWGADDAGQRLIDTCWAILFLRRATRHIVRQKVYTQ